MGIVKRCWDCKVEKPLDNFQMSRRSKDGKQGRCRVCSNKAAIIYNASRREFMKDYDRNKNLGQYGLNVELYEGLLKAQNYCCASCGRNQSEFTTKFVVDHDHSCCPKKKSSCGKCIRGLLCNNCNVGLGHASDSVDRLMQMAAYLMKFENVLIKEMS
jgi:hypothetical protein